MSKRSTAVDPRNLSPPRPTREPMNPKEVEWECPKCHQSYVLAVALMKREKRYHKPEVSDI